MKRPAFQFYPGDWRGNAKLRRCSEAARGAWIDIMCVLHDADEYGMVHWPLADLARAAGVATKSIKELVEKEVLKGGDHDVPPLVFVPRHAGKDGSPVTLIAKSSGPVWYSSRMVRDEYVRSRRGASTRFSTENQSPKWAPNTTPMPPIGERQGDGASSSSSVLKQKHVQQAARFEEFWSRYPLKKGRAAALRTWRSRNLDAIADQILTDVTERAQFDRQWLAGYVPHGSTYVNGSGWEDAIERGSNVVPHPAVNATPSPASQRRLA